MSTAPRCAECGRRRSALSVRDEWICSAFLSGATYEQIGQEHGITRQRVEQIIKARGLPARAIREARMPHSSVAREWAKTSIKCFVCWKVFRSSDPRRVAARTPACSKACSDLFRRTRHIIDQAAFLRSAAAVYLRRKPNSTWALGVLAGEPRQSWRSFPVAKPGTKVAEAYAEVCRLRVQNSLQEDSNGND